MPSQTEQKTYSVYELNSEIKRILEGSFTQYIWVKGEIIGFNKQIGKKHMYFQLQEKDASGDNLKSTIPVTLFAGDIIKVLNKFKEGNLGRDLCDDMEARVLCKVNVYPPHGSYNLVIKDIDPEFTLGKMAQNREAIIAYLKSKNLLDRNKITTTLPLVPQSIGLITTMGEGYHDFINKLKESNLYFKVYFYPATVQGKNVETEVCRALDYFNTRNDIQVIVITRGGGSRTDLIWFDNKKIAEKIALMKIPIITGIGHTRDISITDMVAFSSQQTPSAVATFIVEKVNNFLRKIELLTGEMEHNAQNIIRFQKQILEQTREQINRESSIYLERNREKINNLYKELLFNLLNFIRNIKENLGSLVSIINSYDPLNTVKMGFSISRVGGKVVKSIKEIKFGENMTTTISDGEIESIIK